MIRVILRCGLVGVGGIRPGGCGRGGTHASQNDNSASPFSH